MLDIKTTIARLVAVFILLSSLFSNDAALVAKSKTKQKTKINKITSRQKKKPKRQRRKKRTKKRTKANGAARPSNNSQQSSDGGGSSSSITSSQAAPLVAAAKQAEKARLRKLEEERLKREQEEAAKQEKKEIYDNVILDNPFLKNIDESYQKEMIFRCRQMLTIKEESESHVDGLIQCLQKIKNNTIRDDEVCNLEFCDLYNKIAGKMPPCPSHTLTEKNKEYILKHGVFIPSEDLLSNEQYNNLSEEEIYQLVSFKQKLYKAIKEIENIYQVNLIYYGQLPDLPNDNAPKWKMAILNQGFCHFRKLFKEYKDQVDRIDQLEKEQENFKNDILEYVHKKIDDTTLTDTIYVDVHNVLLVYKANQNKANQEKEQEENQRQKILDQIKQLNKEKKEAKEQDDLEQKDRGQQGEQAEKEGEAKSYSEIIDKIHINKFFKKQTRINNIDRDIFIEIEDLDMDILTSDINIKILKSKEIKNKQQAKAFLTELVKLEGADNINLENDAKLFCDKFE